jgi:putative methanogenesis marker protein 6
VRVAKYVFTAPNSDILPSDIAQMIYSSKYDINVKETCFGAIIDGEEDEILSLVKEIRAMDPNEIFIKDRGFPPGDPRRCRGHRGGGPRPGFHMLEFETRLLPFISEALASEERGEEITPSPEKKKWLSAEKLEEIIEKESS